MIALSGILHPLAFPHLDLMQTMSSVYPGKCETYTYRNVELGCFGAPLAVNPDRTIFVASDGIFDTQELIATYEEQGEKAFQLLKGSCVLFLFDQKKEIVYLIRDRFGKKVLYWTQQGDTWFFSTELKGLLATGLVPQTPSPTGLASYLFFGYEPQEFTPILGVNKLLPGHFLKLDLTGKAAIAQYWSLGNTLKKGGKLEDSSPLKESVLQSRVAFDFDARECLNNLPKIVWHLDEPISDVSIFQAWNLRKSLDRPIIIDRQDEVDEKNVYHPTLYYKLARLPKPLLHGCLLPCLNLFYSNSKWRILRNIDINNALMGDLTQEAIFKGSDRKNVSRFLTPYFDPEVFIERFHHLPDLKNPKDQLFYLKAKTYLSDSFFFQYEKLLPNKTWIEIKNYQHQEIPFHWCEDLHFREVFSLLEKGLLVEEGFISAKWLRHHLGFPHLIPETFRKLFTLLVLEVWFRLFIHQPIGKISWELTTKELLRE